MKIKVSDSLAKVIKDSKLNTGCSDHNLPVSIYEAKEVAKKESVQTHFQVQIGTRKSTMLNQSQAAEFSDSRAGALYELGLRPTTSRKWAEHVEIIDLA